MDLTLEGFQDHLDNDLSWRRVEFGVLTKAVESAAARDRDSAETKAYTRALVALAYAHWEGYSKGALDAYFQYLKPRRLRLDQVNDALLVGQGLRLLRRVQSGDSTSQGLLLKMLRGEADERLGLVRPEMSDTKSNLRHERLTTLLAAFGLDTAPFNLMGNLIDIRLCDRRNAIAHGKADFPEVGDTVDLKDQVIDLMERMRSVLVRAVSDKTYYADARTGPQRSEDTDRSSASVASALD